MNPIDAPRTNVDMIGVKGLIKIGTLAFVGVLFALGFSWFFKSFLLTGEWGQLIWSSLFAIGFLVVFTLQTFFIRSNMHFALAFLVQSIALLGFFITLTTPIVVLFIAVYSLLLSASFSGRKILENTLKIDFWNISKLIVPKGIIALTLLVSVFYPLHLLSNPDKLPLSQATFGKLLASSNVFIKYFYEDFDANGSVDDFVRSTTERKLSSAFPQIDELKPSEKELIVRENMKQFYAQVLSYTGLRINPKEPISAAAYTILERKFSELKDEVKLWIFIITGALIAISIVSFIMPLRILVGLIAFFVYEVLLALGFAHVSIESRPKETLILD